MWTLVFIRFNTSMANGNSIESRMRDMLAIRQEG